MRLKKLKLSGFKSFAKQIVLDFPGPISAIVGPNGSGKSNVAEAIAWVLGEQSLKSLRGRKGEDLIFNGSSVAARMGKASVVLIFADKNSNDEVSVSRAVYRDGLNEYRINNEQRRLKDVVEFLSTNSAGPLKHHIIGQGDSDRILSVSLKERCEIVEDALGLRIFQLKKEDGARKLKKTEENIEQVKSLRREIQPHLRFLKKQVDKASESFILRDKLKDFCSSYFSRAEARFKKDIEKISEKKKEPQNSILKEEKEIKNIKSQIERFSEKKLKRSGAGEKVNELERKIGRYEGMLPNEKKESKNFFDTARIEGFIIFLEKEIEHCLGEKDAEKIRGILKGIKKRIISLKNAEGGAGGKENSADFQKLKIEYKELLDALEIAKEKEKDFQKEMEESIRMERSLYKAEIKLNRAKSELGSLENDESEIVFKRAGLRKDMEEAETVLKEKIIIEQDNFGEIGLQEIENDRREIERIKIKIEESGNIGDEILKEYQEIQSRDDFLFSEISDLEKSAGSLSDLIKRLEEKLSVDFKKGVAKINKELQKFFELMFGGGSAELNAVEEGIDIKVALPRKRINSLEMLSGGEKSLISIAFLFAVSQVNPPPFLILDETDAALDESNSRKYAKMLTDLSKQTQLILITHNRETMNVAEVLYGVTMGADGISRLLSVKLEQAEEMIDR